MLKFKSNTDDSILYIICIILYIIDKQTFKTIVGTFFSKMLILSEIIIAKKNSRLTRF